MATGLEAFDALHRRLKGLTFGSRAKVSTAEVQDLAKLTPADLVARGYDERVADEVIAGLRAGDLDPLATSMGVTLSVG